MTIKDTEEIKLEEIARMNTPCSWYDTKITNREDLFPGAGAGNTNFTDIRACYDGRNYIYFACEITSADTVSLNRYDIKAHTVAHVKDLPNNIDYSRVVYDGGDYLYIIGYDSDGDNKYLWRYSITGDSFTTLTAPTYDITTTDVQAPTSLDARQLAPVYDGNDTIYVFFNNNSTAFHKYTISTDTWATAGSFPRSNFDTIGLVYDGDRYLYTLGRNQIINTVPWQGIYRYDLLTQLWEIYEENSDLSAGWYYTYTTGRNLIYLDGYIYIFTLAAYDRICKYSITDKTNTLTMDGASALVQVPNMVLVKNKLAIAIRFHVAWGGSQPVADKFIYLRKCYLK